LAVTRVCDHAWILCVLSNLESILAAVVVAVPTFRRPLGLERLLKALASLETSRDVHVLVADNDAVSHQGADLCLRMTAGKYRWKLDAFIVAERGIAQVRNALVARALMDPETQFVAMLDDDEWPEPQWLESLLRTQHDTGADAVRGNVLRDFEVTPRLWSQDWDGIAPITHTIGEEAMFEGIGNVLFRRNCFEAVTQPYFDPQFGLTGGEDRDFLLRLRAVGTRFSWAEGANAHEFVPASRVALGWSLSRAYRTGNTDMRLTLKHARSASNLLRELGKILAAFALFPVLSIAYSFVPKRRLEGLRRMYRAAGKIGALFGHRYYEYSTHHGR
jgi:GT2 family glycosyltransferase